MISRRLAVPSAFLAVALLAGCVGDPEEPAGTPSTSPPAPDRPPTVDDDRGGEPVSCPPPAAADASDRQQVARVARCAVLAYTEFSWRDDDHRAFLERVAPYATDAFAAELRELFGGDVPAEAAAWEELAAARTVQRTIVLDSDVARSDGADGGGWTVTVETDTERRTEADPDWEPWGEPRSYRVTVVPAGARWLVSDIS